MAALYAGLPYETSATFVEMQCGSSIMALNQAVWKIKADMAEIVICGGTECHSQHPAFMSTTTPPYKELAPICYDKGLTPIQERDIPMICVSDKIAKLCGISRTECDEFALRSQERLQAGYKTGPLARRCLPITHARHPKDGGAGHDQDEFPRPDTTFEGCPDCGRSIRMVSPRLETPPA